MSFFFAESHRTETGQRFKNEQTLLSGCNACPLNSQKRKLHNPEMQPVGPDDADIYILGEAPGEDEDKEGEAFVGKAGRYLQGAFPRNVWQSTRRWNTIRCRPPNNRDPDPKEMHACREYIESDIAKVKPVVVIGTGAVPMSWTQVEKKKRIKVWRGRVFPINVRGHTCWYAPVLHPSYFVRMGAESNKKRRNIEDEEQVFHRDINRAIRIAEIGMLPKRVCMDWVRDGIRTFDGSDLLQLDKIERILNRMKQLPNPAIDTETWPLRPYQDDSMLLTVAIGSFDEVVVFPVEHFDMNARWKMRALSLLEDFIRNSNPKTCHNLVFELEWFASRFGKSILRSTEWNDSMAQAFVLDDRTERMEMLALDVRVRQMLGFNLKELSGLDRKDMRKHPLPLILDYNGLDTKWTDGLFTAQRPLVERSRGLSIEYDRLIRSSATVALMQRKGVSANQEEVKRISENFSAEMGKIDKRIQNFKEVLEFEVSKGKRFNPDSSDQVGDLLYHSFGHESVLAPKGGYQTGEPILSALGSEIADLILEWRAATKMKSTFVDPLLPGAKKSVLSQDGKVHTSYNLLLTGTGRLSSNDPNLQNFPKRKMLWVRKVIKALLGCIFVSVDYGAIEARVIAMASLDRTLIDALWNDYDIHMDWANRLLAAADNEWKDLWWTRFDRPSDEKVFLKLVRQLAKNQWVFPQFFGSSASSCARSLNLDEDVANSEAREFWYMFSGVKDWQKWLVDFYNENGYVENLLQSRRRRAPLSYNQIINTPIQGTASDIVVDAMNRLSELSEETEREELHPIMNVHDDLTFDIPEELVDGAQSIIVDQMLYVPFEFAKVVPIELEVAHGKTWGDMQEVGKFNSKGACG